jgi:hypothetical protein
VHEDEALASSGLWWRAPRPGPREKDGWRDQGVLAISIDDERLSWPERELVRQLGDKLYGPRHREPEAPDP